MANIRERKGKFQVQTRRAGSVSITRTLLCKRQAVKWAMKTEIELEQGSFNRIDLAALSVGDLLNRYRQTVVPRKRCHQTEDRRLQRLIQDPISNILLSEITSADIAVFRDRRLSDGIRTCQYDLSILRHMFRIAIEEWSRRYSINLPLAHHLPCYRDSNATGRVAGIALGGHRP